QARQPSLGPVVVVGHCFLCLGRRHSAPFVHLPTPGREVPLNLLRRRILRDQVGYEVRREAEPGPGGSPRRWAAAGLAGSSTATVAAALVHTAFPSVPFPPLSIAQAIVRAAPGGFAPTFIDLLGHRALRLALAGEVAP